MWVLGWMWDGKAAEIESLTWFGRIAIEYCYMHFPRLSCSCTCSSEELRGADVLPSLPGAQAKRRRLALTLTRNGGCQVRKPHICRWDAFVYYTRHGMVQHDIIISASKPEQKERPRFQASTKPLNHALQCNQHFARFGKKQLSNATPKQTCRAPAAQHQLHSRPYLQGLHVHHPATSLPGQLGSSWTYFGSAAGFPWQVIEYDRILTSWLHPSLTVSISDMVDGLFSQLRSNFNQEGMRHALPNGHF